MPSDAMTTLILVGAASAHAAELRAAGFAIAAAGDEADAVLVFAATREELTALADKPVAAVGGDIALVVLSALADDALEARLLRAGVEAIVTQAEGPQALARAIRHAVERKRLECAARTAYATDLSTGLPHQAQLLEHMAQLLALRDREPVPMGLIALRLEGLGEAEARLGAVAAQLLRRKVAVRLRGGLRASDVVASLGGDGFAVLLGRLENKGDGERVVAKLTRSLHQPLVVGGEACSVRVCAGLAVYPDHGRDARSLLQRALAQAGWVVSDGGQRQVGPGAHGATRAANDP